MNIDQKLILICSGGLDSIVLAYHLASKDQLYGLISFDYGQRHVKELDFSALVSKTLEVSYTPIDLRAVSPLLRGSGLTDPSVEIPSGHYAEGSMSDTVVPNRNMIMLSIASASAISEGVSGVATAVHSGDRFIYPDCRLEFVRSMTDSLRFANEGYCLPGFHIAAPFITYTKSDIVLCGASLGVPFEQTWSCYRGGDIHCGACGTCFERREAFVLANIPDPTQYLSFPDYVDPTRRD